MKSKTVSHSAKVILAALFSIFLWATVASAATETVLHSFGSGNDGSTPFAGLKFDQNGNLYGTASAGGGSGCGGMGCGIVYELAAGPGGTWTYNVLHRFVDSEGGNSFSVIAMDSRGALYGTNLYWGPFHSGTVFQLTPAGGSWIEKTVHAFTAGNDGFSSYGVAFDKSGQLYGTAYGGGPHNNGLVFNLGRQSALYWYELVLHAFSGADGNAPSGDLTFDDQGNIYGTTYEGGPALAGLVFKLTKGGGAGWSETVLYKFQGSGFSGGPDGVNPVAGVVFDADGNLYGAADYGGPANLGAVYKLTKNPDGTYTESVLYAFKGGSDGGHPYGGVILGPDGSIYGTTQGHTDAGTVYKLTKGGDGKWTETVLHEFTGGSDGALPYSGLVMDSAGNLYGTTSFGGQFNGGVIFEITP